VNVSSFRAFVASVILLGLPVAEFVRDGSVSEPVLGALLICAFGGGGFAADKALKARVRQWAGDDDKEGKDA
jgi:hypothetical protein